MKKLNFLLIILLAIRISLFSQSCLPEGIEFTTQTAIDSFQMNYPDCTEIEGDVFIGYWNGNYTITNLDSLESITSIGGRLDIVRCENLTSLAGLDFISTIGDWLLILENNSLLDFSGLQSITTIGNGLAIESNNSITSITGLEYLTSIGGQLSINNNSNLTNLSGLVSLNEINGSLCLMTNVSLTDISGIENINPNSIQESLAIRHNYSLSNCAIFSVCDYIADPNGIIVINDNANGCNSQAEVEIACEELFVNNKIVKDKFTIFPNPANRILTVSSQSGNPIEEINIYNLQGQKTLSLNPIKNTIDVSNLQKGFYTIEVKYENYKYNKKLIIE
jgi:hypothetical protein